MSMDQFQNTLQILIDTDKIFHIKFYVIDDNIKAKVEHALNLMFGRYAKDDIMGVIYSCVKELMINGTKANLKRVLFEKNSLNIDDPQEYLQGMMHFKDLLNERAYHSYLDDLKSMDLWVNVRFEYGKEGIRLIVNNNTHLTDIEDKRLREKLGKAMQYDDIAQFYMDQGDELEGAGMGIALIIMLLKGIEVDPHLFRIGNTDSRSTFARLEIPFTTKFLSMRDNTKVKNETLA